jgi:hypothetical protein
MVVLEFGSQEDPDVVKTKETYANGLIERILEKNPLVQTTITPLINLMNQIGTALDSLHETKFGR